MLSLTAFGIASLSRPIGALILGSVGDRYGTKTAIEIALLLVGFSTLIMSLLPTYSDIGPFAPALLFALRFCQGFGIGGNTVTTMIYAKEHNESGGIAVALAYGANFSGLILGNLICIILKNTLNNDQLQEFGWRIAFAVGSIAAVSGFFMKFFVKNDTPNPQYDLRDHYKKVFSPKNLKPIFTFVGIASFGFTSFFTVFVWMPAVLSGLLKPPIPHTLIVNLCVMLVTLVFFIPFAGMIIDRTNPLHIIAFAFFTASISFPISYSLIIHFKTTFVYGVVIFICGIWCAVTAPAQFIYVEKRFPPEERVTAMSFGNHLSSAIFGAFTPAIAVVLFKVNKYLPPVLVSGTGVLSLICLYIAHTSLPTYEDDSTDVSKSEENIAQEIVEEEIDEGIKAQSAENVV